MRPCFAEINAEFAIFPCDDRLRNFLKARGDTEIDAVDADRTQSIRTSGISTLGGLVPYVALPHYIPKNCRPVTDVAGMKLDQVLVGSCSNGRIEDIALIAELVKGKRVAKGMRFIVTPASQKIYLEALKAGYLETLVEAGAVVTNATCGACYGGHMGLLGPGERCLSTTTRNFKARMGDADSEVLLSAPATAAASALTGVITDPREFWEADHEKLKAGVWVFGDEINTDLIFPHSAFRVSPEEPVKLVFSDNRPGWSSLVQKGDILIAGANFGTGSSRPGAVLLRRLGLACMAADSINGLFYRNCVSYGFPALQCPGVAADVRGGRYR